ncbi:hypothetical protein GPJ56_001340 [Histomonas meleagridis]|uniref:uncharacterized protein n=1 Tax=Histomonas meleagridis TaxID=135588 RepID=UPI003559965C|nr:hypothetical protein GPJ56_001340 [Histomonas meleagridis]KAH0805096.1 hypothetical protein GO595_002041 [Histomonas meleagridis]
MKPKVAAIFGGSSKRAPPSSALKRNTEMEVKVELEENENREFEKLLSSNITVEEKEKPKYIFAALEKADERRAVADTLRNLRNERELEKLEKEQGNFLRFYTNGNEADNPTESEIQNISTEQLDSKIMSEEQIQAIDFDAMKERYLERLNEKDILKLIISQKKMNMIVNFAQMIKEQNA